MSPGRREMGGSGASEVADSAAVRPRFREGRLCCCTSAVPAFTYRPKGASEEDTSLMGEIERQYLETPFYGSGRMRA